MAGSSRKNLPADKAGKRRNLTVFLFLMEYCWSVRNNPATRFSLFVSAPLKQTEDLLLAILKIV